jgi:lipopolysaccharide export system permease protein
VVLVTIVMTMMLIRTLGLAAKGSVNPQEVMMVMAYTVLGYLPTILSLSLFIAIVGTLSRMYRDSEMVIWFSSRPGPGRLRGAAVRLCLAGADPDRRAGAGDLALGQLSRPGLKDRYGSAATSNAWRPASSRSRPAAACASSSWTRTRRTTSPAPTSSSGPSSAACRPSPRRAAAASKTMGDSRFLMLSNGQRLERPLLPASGLQDQRIRRATAPAPAAAPATAWTTPPRARTTLSLLRDRSTA